MVCGMRSRSPRSRVTTVPGPIPYRLEVLTIHRRASWSWLAASGLTAASLSTRPAPLTGPADHRQDRIVELLGGVCTTRVQAVADASKAKPTLSEPSPPSISFILRRPVGLLLPGLRLGSAQSRSPPVESNTPAGWVLQVAPSHDHPVPLSAILGRRAFHAVAMRLLRNDTEVLRSAGIDMPQ